MSEEKRKEHRTSYADDAIDVENGTQPEEVQSFVERRASNPVTVDGVKVWNFNNHVVNEQALTEAEDFLHDEFIIPYSTPGAWGYMVALLPGRIREAEILVYNQNRGRYYPYPNLERHASEENNEDVRRRIAERIREGTE